MRRSGPKGRRGMVKLNRKRRESGPSKPFVSESIHVTVRDKLTLKREYSKLRAREEGKAGRVRDQEGRRREESDASFRSWIWNGKQTKGVHELAVSRLSLECTP